MHPASPRFARFSRLARFTALVTLLSLPALLPSPLSASGSCTWIDLAPLLDQAPGLRDHLTATLEIDETGIASRLGPHIPRLSGSRVAPYRFRARSRLASLPAEFDLEILAEWTLLDEAGQPVPPGDEGRASQVSETFTGVRLLPAVPSAVPFSIEDPNPERSTLIRTRFNDLNLQEHHVRSISFTLPEHRFSGKAVFHTDPATSQLHFITVDGERGDRSAFSESFYFDQGELFFAFRQSRRWNLHPENPGDTVETILEERFYFENGEIYRALQREYDSAQRPTSIPDLPIGLRVQDAMQLFSRSSRLVMARSPEQLGDIYDDLLDASAPVLPEPENGPPPVAEAEAEAEAESPSNPPAPAPTPAPSAPDQRVP